MEEMQIQYDDPNDQMIAERAVRAYREAKQAMEAAFCCVEARISGDARSSARGSRAQVRAAVRTAVAAEGRP